MKSHAVLVAVFVIAITLMAFPAKAAFLFCNNTKQSIEGAFGYRDDDNEWVAEGWWQIQPGQCARTFNKPLTQRYYFYYARALGKVSGDKGTRTWSGKYAFCTDNKAFRINGDDNCEARGYQLQGFQEVDIGPGNFDYTLKFQ